MASRQLLLRRIWKDPLLWLWLLALPVSFQATYWWDENVRIGIDSGQTRALQILVVWLVLTVIAVLGAHVGKLFRRGSL